MQYKIEKKPINKEEMNMLDALSSMWNQYCSDSWHCSMSAWENCSAILQEYWLLPDIEDWKDPTAFWCKALSPYLVFITNEYPKQSWAYRII